MVVKGQKEYRLRQIPATFLNKNCSLFIGAGALIDPEVLAAEVAETGTQDRIIIDPQAGILEKKHCEQEGELVANIGSTGKGCGAALVDRIWRKDFKLAGEVLKDNYRIENVAGLLAKAVDDGKRILVEGTQGFGLSLYHGIYPYVTSRDTTAANFLAEAGLSPLTVKDIVLVIRTFPIRVAGPSGPLKGETSWDVLTNKLGKEVIEMTTVTGKVRRVAKFDPEIVKEAIAINRPTQIALQFLNYLFPDDEGKAKWEELSSEAKTYVETLEKELGVPITLVGTGKAETAMILREIS